MRLTIARIREITGGEQHGNGSIEILGLKSLETAGPTDLSFVRGPAYFSRARESRAGVMLCPELLDGVSGIQIVVPDPQEAMAAVLRCAEEEIFGLEKGIDPRACVHETARVGEEVFIGSCAVVEEGAKIGAGSAVHAGAVVGRRARVGMGCVIHPCAVLGEGVNLGDRCVVGPNSCLGSQGFSVAWGPGGELHSMPQIGGVEVGDDVEIGALCSVDRGTMTATVIGSGTKMDNHCHIAHNVKIGRNCLLVAYARIAGSTVLEDNVTVAEDVGITDNVRIGKGARIGGGSRVYKSIPPGGEVWGAPAKPLAEEKRLQAILRRMPALREKLRELWRRRGN